MRRLVALRCAAIVPALVLVSFGVFMLLSLVPGDPAVALAGGASASPEAIARVRAELRLDDPLLVQYGRWLSDIARLDLGSSLSTGAPVADEIASRFPVTLSLVAAATVVTVVVGVPLGVSSGARPGRPVDVGARLLSSLGVAVPNFWLAVLLVSSLSVQWNLFPPTGYVRLADSFVDWIRYVTLPALALGLLGAATLARQLRTGVIDVMSANFVRTAWAKGCSTRAVLFRHVLRNAAIPAVTVLGIQIGYLLGGAVLIEQIFSIPGMGTYMLQGITSQDLPVVQGVAIVFVVFQMGISLLVDISYGALNPKVRVAG